MFTDSPTHKSVSGVIDIMLLGLPADMALREASHWSSHLDADDETRLSRLRTEQLRLRYSLSYTGGLIACAVTRETPIELRVDAFNLLDSSDDDISYYYASRLEGEPAERIEDVHFHPLEPRSVRASITFHW